MKKYQQYLSIGLLSLVIAIFFASCATTVNVPYFRDVPDSSKVKQVAEIPYSDPIIQPDDILAVTIITIDPTTAAPVNQAANVPVTASGASQSIPGLLVDRDGNISLPILGIVKVGGLTTYQAKALIKSKADLYFKNPDVQLRFANFKVTVLGEVAHPATYVLPNEKVSVLDALGLAGDLTIYGRRENVMIIRDSSNIKVTTRIDLNKTDLFKSPFFYLKQNDVVYVEPNRAKIVSSDAGQSKVITIIASVTATLLILLLRLKL